MPDDFNQIEQDLRNIDREFRREAAADEELTELQRRRREGLAGVLQRSMHRGDLVTVEIGGVTIRGQIAEAGSDYVTFSDAGREIDVRTTGAVFTVRPARAGGTSGRPASLTFRARLAEHEQIGLAIEVATSHGNTYTGIPGPISTDHLHLVDDGGTETIVPLDLVVAVFSSLR